MARPDGTFVWDRELTKSVLYKILLGPILTQRQNIAWSNFNIETCSRTLKHKTYNAHPPISRSLKK